MSLRTVTVQRKLWDASRDGPDRGGWRLEEPWMAHFHQFGLALHEPSDGGAVSYTVAVVEREDGTVAMVDPDYVKFDV